MENFLEVMIVGLVLCADSFSAALAMGFRKHKLSDSLKFAFSSGGAEALFTFLGAIAGSKVITYFGFISNWISFILLFAVALHMAFEGFTELRNGEREKEVKKFHSFYKILIVSFATSLDAFVVGVSLGISERPLIPFLISIGLWAFISTIVGMSIASRVSKRLGPTLNLIGSVILIILAFKFLLQGQA